MSTLKLSSCVSLALPSRTHGILSGVLYGFVCPESESEVATQSATSMCFPAQQMPIGGFAVCLRSSEEQVCPSAYVSEAWGLDIDGINRAGPSSCIASLSEA